MYVLRQGCIKSRRGTTNNTVINKQLPPSDKGSGNEVDASISAYQNSDEKLKLISGNFS